MSSHTGGDGERRGGKGREGNEKQETEDGKRKTGNGTLDKKRKRETGNGKRRTGNGERRTGNENIKHQMSAFSLHKLNLMRFGLVSSHVGGPHLSGPGQINKAHNLSNPQSREREAVKGGQGQG